MKMTSDYSRVAATDIVHRGEFLPQQGGQSWNRMDRDSLESVWLEKRGSTVRFRGQGGEILTGKLVDLLDEGVFVIETANGMNHDVNPSDIFM